MNATDSDLGLEARNEAFNKLRLGSFFFTCATQTADTHYAESGVNSPSALAFREVRQILPKNYHSVGTRPPFFNVIGFGEFVVAHSKA